MTPLYKILSISVISVICASKMFAQSDSILCALSDTTYNNTIKDTIVLEYSKGYVRFETIRREGDKYFAVTSDNKDVEITSMINGKTRALVQDGDGHELVIDKDGNVMGVEEYKKCGGSKALLRELCNHKDSLMVGEDNISFYKPQNEVYGFDEWRGESYDRDIYPIVFEGNSYRPAHIGVGKGSAIRIGASRTEGVAFKTESGVPIVVKDGLLQYATSRTGEQAIYAYRDSVIVGKLVVQAYERKKNKVHIVSVNGAETDDAKTLQDVVNGVFAQAVQVFEIDKMAGVSISYANGKNFVHGGKGTFQNYNADQKAAIKALPEIADKNDYYLFYVDNAERLDTAGNKARDIIAGYMPVGRHYGFLYGKPNPNYIAHELGHGTDALHHTFSEDSESFYTTAKTDNLMDYEGGARLNHRQWQWAHENHRNVLGFLDEEGEGEASYMLKEYDLKKLYMSVNDCDTIYNSDKYYLLNTKDENRISVYVDTVRLKRSILNHNLLEGFMSGVSSCSVNYDERLVTIYRSYADHVGDPIDSIKGQDLNSVQYDENKEYCLSIDLTKALNVKYTDIDNKEHVRRLTKDELVSIGYSLMCNIQIVKVPIVRFRPTNTETYYQYFGFDDAELKENQLSNHYAKTTISGADYSIPCMFLYGSNAASVTLRTSTDIIDSLGYFKISGNDLLVNGQKEIVIGNRRDMIKIDVMKNGLGIDTLNVVYCIGTKEVMAGKLIVERRNLIVVAPMVFVITKVGRSESFPVVDINPIFVSINELYKQAGIQFSSYSIDTVRMDSTKPLANIVLDHSDYLSNKRQTLTIFMFDASDENRKVNGDSFMPLTRNSRFDFPVVRIFNIRPTTISHEIGHTLGLPHVFETVNTKADMNRCLDNSKDVLSTKDHTRNIMDYDFDAEDKRRYFNMKQINHIYNHIKAILK